MEEALRDPYNCQDFERIAWRLRAGGWAKRQFLAGGVSFRQCCAVMVIGCLCERCMLTLKRDEARKMANFWEGKVREFEGEEQRREMKEKRRLGAKQIEEERPRRRRVANVAETPMMEEDVGTDTSEEESGGGQ